MPLLLAGCGGPPSDNAPPTVESANPDLSATPEAPKIECALSGSTEFAAACTVERAKTPDGVILTLRHPDGGFHRLQITRDGRGVIAADGAQPAKVKALGSDRIEVEVGGARYRLPATIRPQSP